MKTLQRKPRKGDRVGFGHFVSRPHNDRELAAIGHTVSHVIEPGAPTHIVTRTPEPGDNLCWIAPLVGRGDAQPFIWNFREGRNQLARIFDDTGAPIECDPGTTPDANADHDPDSCQRNSLAREEHKEESC
jgi:hypothetical protein